MRDRSNDPSHHEQMLHCGATSLSNLQVKHNILLILSIVNVRSENPIYYDKWTDRQTNGFMDGWTNKEDMDDFKTMN